VWPITLLSSKGSIAARRELGTVLLGADILEYRQFLCCQHQLDRISFSCGPIRDNAFYQALLKIHVTGLDKENILNTTGKGI